MDMDELYRVEDIVYKELKSVTDNGKFRSREEIDNVYKLIDVLKDLRCLEDDYSEGNRDWGSYRGRKRDSMGRYSGERRRYSGKPDFISQLETLMEDAPDETTRKNIQRMIDEMG